MKHAVRMIAIALASILVSAVASAQVPAPAWTASSDASAAQSIRLFVGEKKDMSLTGTVRSLVVVDPAPVAAEVVSGVGLRLTGLALGETLVIAMTPRGRVTFVVEVVGRPAKPVEIRTVDEIALLENPTSGSITTSYSPALTGTHASIRQRVEFKHELSPDRTLRVSGEMVKFFNRASVGPSGVASPSFGFNRLSVGMTSSLGTINVLDSTLNISPMSLAGYTMRGLHLVAAPATRFDGLDLFAGVARPDFGSIGEGEGWIIGGMMPIVRTDDWRVRSGAISISPSDRNATDRQIGGPILQMDALFSPSKDTRFFAELAYSNGGISGGAEFTLHRSAFDTSAAFSRLASNSPLISIGAQGAGKTLVSGTFSWHPEGPFRAFASYTRTVQTAVLTSRPSTDAAPAVVVPTAPLANETLQVTATVDLPSRSQLSARFTNQRIDVLGGAGTTPFRLDTRAYGLAYSARLGERWTNRLDVSFTSSSEGGGSEVKKGFDIREDLRRSWKGGSASGFFRYLSNSESLVGVILRNPSILPVELRPEFALDPARFLAANDELLRSLFPGVALPYSSRTEFGFRFQNTFSRWNISSETAYRKSGSLLGEEGGLTQSVGASYRLDSANSFQINASHTFGGGTAPSVSSLTVSYTHRFGASAGDGFQFGDLFGLDRGRVRGRVFLDLNVNGIDDEGEPGVAEIGVSVDGGLVRLTDGEGRFEFTIRDRSLHTVALAPDVLGVVLRASTDSEQKFSVAARATAEVNFGVTNYGSLGGRVYNDLTLAGASGVPLNNPGLQGVRVLLRQGSGRDSLGERITDSSGGYVFSNLSPGTYSVEYDVGTLPLDFRVGTESAWPMVVVPLRAAYVDIPVAAERAIAGTVYRDRNGNRKFDEGIDEPVSGARVRAGAYEATSGANGRYLLRHLPAAALALQVALPSGVEVGLATITLGKEPSVRRGVDFPVSVGR